MSLADYQKQVDDSVQPLAKPYWDPLSQLAGISEGIDLDPALQRSIDKLHTRDADRFEKKKP